MELIPELLEFAEYMVAVGLVVILLVIRNLPAVLVEAVRMPPDVPVYRNLLTLNYWLLLLTAFAQTACFAGEQVRLHFNPFLFFFGILTHVPTSEFLNNTFIAVAFGGLTAGALIDTRISNKVHSHCHAKIHMR